MRERETLTSTGSPSRLRAGLVADGLRGRRLARTLERAGVACSAYDSGDAPDGVVVSLSGMQRRERRVLASLRDELDGAVLVVVLPEPDAGAVRLALDAGADAVVAEDEVERCLGPALQAGMSGQLVLPRSFRDRFGRPVLSPREKQVLSLVVMGFANAEIARRLHVAESTVKTHLTSAFAKLGVRSRSGAVALLLDPVQGYGLGVLAISGDGGNGVVED